MADVKLLKMFNGEELLAETLEISTTLIKIKNPVRVLTVPSKANPQMPQVAFAPWAEFSEEKEMTIDRSHIIVVLTPIKEFVAQYTAMFSGLVLPQKSGLIAP